MSAGYFAFKLKVAFQKTTLSFHGRNLCDKSSNNLKQYYITQSQHFKIPFD